MRPELTAGSAAPTFEAKTDSGDTFNLADYRGQKVAFNMQEPLLHAERGF